MTTQATQKAPGQLRSFLRAMHPRQALAFAVVVGLLRLPDGAARRREVLIAAAAVLVAQLVMGLVNDLSDAEADRRSGRERQARGGGDHPAGQRELRDRHAAAHRDPALAAERHRGRAVPARPRSSSASCTTAGCTAPLLSWVGWSATFALLTYFITFGGWGSEADGSAPLTSFVMLSALLGFLRALPDLAARPRRGQQVRRATPAAAGGAEDGCAPAAGGDASWRRSWWSPLLIYKALTVGIAY